MLVRADVIMRLGPSASVVATQQSVKDFADMLVVALQRVGVPGIGPAAAQTQLEDSTAREEAVLSGEPSAPVEPPLGQLVEPPLEKSQPVEPPSAPVEPPPEQPVEPPSAPVEPPPEQSQPVEQPSAPVEPPAEQSQPVEPPLQQSQAVEPPPAPRKPESKAPEPLAVSAPGLVSGGDAHDEADADAETHPGSPEEVQKLSKADLKSMSEGHFG